MARKSNPKTIIVCLVILLFILLTSVGYAVFSESLTVSGTANAKGTFDLVFQDAKVVDVTTDGVDVAGTTAQITDDGDTLIVNVADIAHPGAGAEFSVDIVNMGTIPAEIKSVIPIDIRGYGLAKITGLEEIGKESPTLQPKEKYNIHFRVEWDKDIVEEQYIDNILKTEGDTVNFKLDIEYVQKTNKIFESQTSHIDL